MPKIAGRAVKSLLTLLVALGVVLATPGAGQAQSDPASVARALIDAENRHDVEAAVALFTPDAVVVHATGTLTTTAEIRKWQTELADGNFRATIIGTPTVAGDKVTFNGDVALNTFTSLGIDKLDATWELTVQQGRVKMFNFVFSPASSARLQQAIAGSASLALTGTDPRPLVERGALLLLLGVALLAGQRRRS
jgi:ketosteroid isomerase-like protein